MDIERKPIISSIKQIYARARSSKKRSSKRFFVVPLFLAFVFVWLFLKKWKKTLSGRHKKTDKCVTKKRAMKRKVKPKKSKVKNIV